MKCGNVMRIRQLHYFGGASILRCSSKHCGIIQYIVVFEFHFLLKLQASLGCSYARFVV